MLLLVPDVLALKKRHFETLLCIENCQERRLVNVHQFPQERLIAARLPELAVCGRDRLPQNVEVIAVVQCFWLSTGLDSGLSSFPGSLIAHALAVTTPGLGKKDDMGSAASRDPGSSFEDTSRARRVPRQEPRAKSIDSALIEAAASLSLATDARESSERPRAYRALRCSPYWRAQRIPASARPSSSRSLLAPSRVAELRP